ncbi:MAG: methyltransferase domain-containing protein, partial [Candidatus Aminicenantes bacterium]
TDGNLFVSTDNGNIYCFVEGKTSRAKEIIPAINPSPYRRDRLTKIYESAAEKILKETGINKGYCLVLGCGTGRLAFELAKQSNMKIIGIEKDAKKVNTAKNRLDSAGLYGSRVVVEQWDFSTLPDYFADLIVSDEMMISGEIKCSSEEMFRVLKPYGGVAYFGQSTEASKRAKSLDLQNLLGWLRNSGAPEPEVDEENGIWVKTTRGKLEGAGSWTEQYGNPQNTASSEDQLVKGPLGVLWYGEPGSERMVERHAKAASPVSINGRIFIQGEEVIMAYDAFNGTFLWKREIPGAVRARADMDGGNLAVTEDALYVAVHDKCYCLDPATGETIRIFEIPPSFDGTPRRWGYVSCTDNILYGSSAMPLIRDYFTLSNTLIQNGKWRDADEIPSQYREEYEYLTSIYPVPDEKLWTFFKRSGALWRLMADFPDWEIYQSSEGALTKNMMVSDTIFAMDTETGKLLWKHQGKRIAHITITSGDGTIFFAESAVSTEKKKYALQIRGELIRKGIYEESEEGEVAYDETDVRLVVALDSKSGKKLWERLLDLTGSGGDGMGTAYQDGVLLIFQNVGTHDAWRFQEGSLRWRRLTALSAKNGNVLWSHPVNYNVRPVIVGNQIFIEPRACDLHTGKIKMRSHPITGKQVPWEYLRPGHTCAISSASANMLFYRSFSTAIYDFSEDRGLVLFGGIRPGCWINMIAANGVLLFPEASSGCTCSFPLRCSLVLKHKSKRPQPWTVFIAHGAMSPVKHFAINLGAPADMKDDKKQVWFAYPNPKTEYLSNNYPNYGVKFDLHDKILLGMGYFCSDFKSTTIEGSEKPWLFTSGCIGLSRLEIPLIDDAWGEEPGVYTLRLGFNAPLGDRTEQRVFSIKLQGNTILKNLDIIKEAGGANKVVIKEFNGIKVENVLAVELVSKDSNPTISQAPIINFIEVLREDVAKISEISEPLSPITKSYAEALLKEAKTEFIKKNYTNSLDKYHIVLDAAPSVNLKQQALEGMASIGSPDSLSRIAAYCRDTAPILWNYKEPKQELNNKAAEVLIAIAANTAKSDKQKAIKMFKNALANANEKTYKKAFESLKNLDVKLDDATDK